MSKPQPNDVDDVETVWFTCFECGEQGHKTECCPTFRVGERRRPGNHKCQVRPPHLLLVHRLALEFRAPASTSLSVASGPAITTRWAGVWKPAVGTEEKKRRRIDKSAGPQWHVPGTEKNASHGARRN